MFVLPGMLDEEAESTGPVNRGNEVNGKSNSRQKCIGHIFVKIMRARILKSGPSSSPGE